MDAVSSSSPSLTDRAQAIPSMGGAKLAPTLRAVAALATPHTAVVEVGTWMGSGTAQLALGLHDAGRDRDVTIHAYDRWRASAFEARTATARGADIRSGDDLLPTVRASLAPFGVDVEFHQGEVTEAMWGSTPISVYVDDAAKMPVAFRHVITTFGPSWIPGVTVIVLMDYSHWRKAPRVLRPLYRCQQRFVESHPASFVPWDGSPQPRADLAAAVFRYEEPLDFAQVAADRWLHRAAAAERMMRRLTPGR